MGSLWMEMGRWKKLERLHRCRSGFFRCVCQATAMFGQKQRPVSKSSELEEACRDMWIGEQKKQQCGCRIIEIFQLCKFWPVYPKETAKRHACCIVATYR